MGGMPLKEVEYGLGGPYKALTWVLGALDGHLWVTRDVHNQGHEGAGPV